MSHDPNNKDCLRNYLPSDFNILLHDLPDCTCPPAVDEVEQIRGLIGVGKLGITAERSLLALLRIVDQLRAELVTNAFLLGNAEQTIEDLRADLAAAQSKLERLRAENAELKTYCQHDASCQSHNQISPCNCGLSALQEPTK